MADPYLGEIRIFAGNFAPKNWALCLGQLLPIAHNNSLFQILGTTYGGDGKSTFALPNLSGSVAIGAGAGDGLSVRNVGDEGGEQYLTLLQSEMPAHTHTPMGYSAYGGSSNPENAVWATPLGGSRHTASSNLYSPAGNAQMGFQALSIAGGSYPHNNMQPYLALNFIICILGYWPPKPTPAPSQAPAARGTQ